MTGAAELDLEYYLRDLLNGNPLTGGVDRVSLILSVSLPTHVCGDLTCSSHLMNAVAGESTTWANY
eukprot:43141-Eustigmatos_ZCMA.PRE.1